MRELTLSQEDREFFEVKLKEIIDEFANKMISIQEINTKIHTGQNQAMANLLERFKKIEERLDKLEAVQAYKRN